jgi:hypothetical protein
MHDPEPFANERHLFVKRSIFEALPTKVVSVSFPPIRQRSIPSDRRGPSSPRLGIVQRHRMRRMVPEGAESRGRSDCQKVSTDRNAVGELRAADGVERSGHRRNGYFLARARSDRRIKENRRVRREAQQTVFARPFRSGRRGSSLERFCWR